MAFSAYLPQNEKELNKQPLDPLQMISVWGAKQGKSLEAALL